MKSPSDALGAITKLEYEEREARRPVDERTELVLDLPIRAESLNAVERMYYRKRNEHRQRARNAVAVKWASQSPGKRLTIQLPCVVTLTRVGPRAIDTHDNLRAGTLKAVVDRIAKQLGVDDADPRVTWEYRQKKGPHSVRVEIRSVKP